MGSTQLTKVAIIKILIPLTLFHQIHGFPDGSCSPRDCTLQDWTHWGDCSQSCGEDGVQTRTRLVLREASCGGTCDYKLTETLPCNRQCCPMNCIMGPWYAWSCTCSATSCSEPGERKTCNRRRYKYVDAKCGGYCDDRLTEKTCNQLCCYQECKFGMWMEWETCEAQCEQMGTQIRKRLLLQNAECGGDPCGEAPSEERECEGSCCAVNCVQGDWSHWSDCPATCGQANQTRSRYVDQPICGGTPCEEPVSEDYKLCEKYINADCKVWPWSQWTGCQLTNGRCGAGSQERIRSILVDALCRGVPCPDLIEKKNCSGPCCVQDCLVTEWTQWSFCSVDCGKGVSQRSRNITTPADCNGSPCPALLDSRECEEKAKRNCEFSEWTAWSDCNTGCGKGLQLRSRTMLTPATCGGQCTDTQTEDTQPCTSYADRTECKVSVWSDWSGCVRTCEEGVRTRTRAILQQDPCGQACSKFNLVVSAWSAWSECQRNCEMGIILRYRNVTANRVCGGLRCPALSMNTTCHEKCSQLCNQAVCSCEPGYQLQSDGYSCKSIVCNWPRIKNCPEGLKPRELCTTVKMDCPTNQNFNATCHPAGCKSEGYEVKGGPDYVRCLKNQTWSTSTLYCGPDNRPPLALEMNATEINENWPVGTCFAALTTRVDEEPLDTHTYSIVTDSAGILQIEKNRLCLMKQASYENEAYRKFTATIRTTDFDGLFLDKKFLFTVLNANDPPRSARLVPNRIRENSREGTKVGCLDIRDDDPGQNISVFLISSAHNTFQLVEKGDKTCISLAATSDERCYTLGGTFCTLNYEERNHVYITVLAQDDGEPPMMTVFDLKIQVVDVNERPSKLSLDPEDVLEEVEPGDSLATIEVEDDEKQTHTFKILSNPSNLFSIQGYDLVAAKKLDHETNKNKKYTLEISVTDNGTPPFQSTLELVFGVGDVNESPYDLHVTPDNSMFIYDTDQPRVKENLKGEVIGTLSVFDPDEDEEIEMKVISTYSKFNLESKRCVKLQNVNNYCTALIVMEESVDFEKIRDFHITVMATDSHKVRVTEQLTVTVMDANDAPRNILINNQDTDVIKVPEDERSFTLATIRAIDDDKGDNHKFFLSGEAAGNFRIEGDQLMTSPTADLDFETHSTQGLIITATDSGTPQQSFEKTFTISIIDRNEAPSDVRLSGNKISEGSPVGSVIGTLTAQDPDNYESEHQTFIFSLPDDGRGRFEVKGNELVVAQPSMRCGRVLCRLDFEKESQVKIEVMATDNGRPRLSVTRPFAISILDENDAPENLRLTRSSVRENMPAETVVGTLNADDYDNGQTLTFELVDSPDFSVSDDHHLVTNNPLDYEVKFKYSVKVKVTDDGNPPKSSEAVMTVTVQDVNEPPILTTDTMVQVPEDTQIGTVIANLTFIDPDAHANVKVTLNTFQDVFTTTQPTCQDQEESPGTVCQVTILSSANFDYDKRQIYSVPLVARDNQDEEISIVLTIKILNENDPPHDILLDGISTYKVDIVENVNQVDVATLSTLDRDKDQTHTYTIQHQKGDHFAISGNILRLSKAADHEKTPELYLTLRVTDSGDDPSSMDKNITVIVRDDNEQPSQLALSSNTVVENSDAGTVVGSFIAEDPDNADSDSQLFTFHLIDSADGRFIVQGDQLMVAQSNSDCLSKGGDFCHLDYERTSSHSILVSVSDNGVPVKTNRFNLEVTVSDDNDVPRNLRLSKNEVEELAPADTPVGTLGVEDQDVSQTHTFSLLDDAGGLFSITPPNTLVKATGDRLDNKKTYTVQVEAQDNGKHPKSTKETFYLTVTGTDEAPRDLSITSQDGVPPFGKNDPTLPEDAPIGSIVGTVSAEDNDPESDITFELLDNADGHFMIETDAVVCKEQGSGTKCSTHMKVSKAMDYETNSQYTLVVRAVDGQGMQTSESFTVRVTDVNEAPADMAYIGGDILVSENHQGELLSVLTVTDPDRNDSHSFSLTDDAEGRFSISHDGQLKTTEDADLDYERVDQMEIIVQVADRGGLTLEQAFHVKVLDLNEKPESLNISNNKVREMSASGTVVGELQVLDPDNEDPLSQSQEFSFTLLDDAGGRFVLDGNSLVVANGGENCQSKGGTFCTLDYETASSHDIAIEVKDDGEPILSNVFTLSVLVTNMNDPPTDLSLDKMSIPEGLAVGGMIGTLSASDQDEGQDLKFSISAGNKEDTVSVEGNKLLVACSVDFEEKSSYTIKIKVTDTGSPPAETEKVFELTVVNRNESPTKLSVEAAKGGSAVDFPVDEPIVKENLVEGSIIGQVVVLDPDKEEEITAIASSALVSIEEMGCITLTKGTRCVGNIKSETVLNYEDKNSFTTNITVTDTGGEQLVKTFTFTVSDENDDPSDLLVEGSSEAVLTVTENSIDSVVAVLDVVDADANQTHTYAVVDGPQFFYFVGNKLTLTTSADLDYERASEFQVTLSVTDDGKPPSALEKHFTVVVTDLNEPPSSVALSKNQVPENSPVDTVVGTLTTDDPDNEKKMRQSFSYSLTEDDEGRFSIKGDTLTIAKSDFDFEKKRTSIVKVKATDTGSPPLWTETEFVIQILDANDPPINLEFSATSIAEDAEVETVVGGLTAEDDDEGQTLSYNILETDLLTIRDDQVLVNGQLNFEESPFINFTVVVSDDGDPSLHMSKIFSIEVTDVNDGPHRLDLLPDPEVDKIEVSESMKPGETIGSLVVGDEDSPERITFKVVAPLDGPFILDPAGPSCDKGAEDGSEMTVCEIDLQLARKVDFEQLTSDSGTIGVEVTATDKGGLTITNRWDLPVRDTNDPPTDILIEGNVLKIPENMEEFQIGSVSSVDEDRKDSHFYQVLNFWEVFKITRDHMLVVTAPLDYESQSEYEVRIKSVDSGRPSLDFTKTFIFSVTDVNEPPSNITLSHDEVSMVAEVDSVVGFVEVADPDNEDDREDQTFTCVADASQDLFVIDKTDQSLKVKSALPAKNEEIPLSITCTDSGKPSQTLTSVVKVKVTETADVPKSIQLTGGLEVEENKQNVEIGELGVVNALNHKPIAGDFTFSATSDQSGTSFSVNGHVLVLDTALDYEEGEEVHVHVSAIGADELGQEVETQETFLISVQNVNEAPTHIRIYSDTVPENSPAGTVVGDLNTVDPDRDQTYTYRIIGVAAGLDTSNVDPELLTLFELQGRSLVVGTDSARLNFEDTPIYSLSVTSVDPGGLEFTGTVRVRVLDRNDPPIQILLDNTKVAEESPVGTVVGSFSVEDEDEDQTHRCQVENIQDVPFKVEEDVKLVVSRDELNHEGNRNYVIKVVCQDEGSDGSVLKVYSSITIQVTNVNDPPQNITLSKMVVMENLPVGTIATEVKAVDPDNDEISIELIDPDGNFELQGDSTLVTKKTFNYEETTPLAFTIKVTDTGGLSASEHFVLDIGDVNEAPSKISLSKAKIDENTAPGELVGTLRTDDEDHGQSYTYTLSPEELTIGHFTVDGDSLLTGKVPLDFEDTAVYLLAVMSTDDGEPQLSKMSQFNITIVDVNEAPTEIIVQPIPPIPEDAEVGLVLSEIHVDDQEANQSYSCHVTNTDTPFVMQTGSDGAMTLVLNDHLNYETAKTVDVSISCMDGPFEITKDLTITVTDVNEAPTEILLDGPMLLPATGKPGYVIGVLSAVDPDEGQTHTFTVRGPNSDIVQVKEKKKLELIKPLPMDSLIDQASPELVLTIKVVDNGGISQALEQQLKFLITDIDLDALKLPEITIDNKRVEEDAEEGTVIGALYNLNIAVGDNVVFEIIEDVNHLFEISNNSHLVLVSPLVGITSPSVKVTVQARNIQSQQTSSRTITIFIKKSMKCKRDGLDCDFDAKCIHVNASYEYCKCNPGFVGDGYSCKEFDDCTNATAPCENGATCQDAFNDFTCICANGFSGKQCEIKETEITSCSSNKCQNNALCEVDKADPELYICICEPGWTGSMCNSSVDDCETALCLGESKCEDLHLTYLCVCQEGRLGVRCEFLQSSCSASSCTQQQMCVPYYDKEGHECILMEDVLILQIKYKRGRSAEIQGRLRDFIVKYGRFPVRAAGSLTERSRRAADTTSNVHPYITGVREMDSGLYEVKIVVQDSQDVPYTKTVVINSLKKTCDSIDTGDQEEFLLCPALKTLTREQDNHAGSGGDNSDSGSGGGGAAAGAGVGVVVIIILVVVGIILFRKLKRDKVGNSKTNLQQDSEEDDSPADPPNPPASTFRTTRP